VGVRNLSKDVGPIQTVWNEFFQSFPVPDALKGDSQMYTYIAHSYQVAFMNSLKFCFEKRQKNFIKQWMIREGIDLSSLHAIRCAINNWTCSAEIPIEAEDFVREQKHILNPPESGIDYNWIQKNSSTIVKYFWKKPLCNK
jgi:hypothetical protein